MFSLFHCEDKFYVNGKVAFSGLLDLRSSMHTLNAGNQLLVGVLVASRMPVNGKIVQVLSCYFHEPFE